MQSSILYYSLTVKFKILFLKESIEQNIENHHNISLPKSINASRKEALQCCPHYIEFKITKQALGRILKGPGLKSSRNRKNVFCDTNLTNDTVEMSPYKLCLFTNLLKPNIHNNYKIPIRLALSEHF